LELFAAGLAILGAVFQSSAVHDFAACEAGKRSGRGFPARAICEVLDLDDSKFKMAEPDAAVALIANLTKIVVRVILKAAVLQRFIQATTDESPRVQSPRAQRKGTYHVESCYFVYGPVGGFAAGGTGQESQRLGL
jgi:hypothetical protein